MEEEAFNNKREVAFDVSGAKEEIFLSTAQTRYHVVRVAAVLKGWNCDDGDRDDVPQTFHGCACKTASASQAPRVAPQLLWHDKSVTPDAIRRLEFYQRINHFPGMNAVARKAVLFRRLMKVRRKHVLPALQAIVDAQSSGHSSEVPATGNTSKCIQRVQSGGAGAGRGIAADEVSAPVYRALEASLAAFYPESFSTLTDTAALQQHVLRSTEARRGDGSAVFYIIKPNVSCEGKGIRVTPSPLDDLTEEEVQKTGESIVQLYIDRPLLLDGKKFDLRIYVLLTLVCPPPKARPSLRSALATPTESNSAAEAGIEKGALDKDSEALRGIRLYVHRRGLVRVCALPYEAPTSRNRSQCGVHLTNYAVNKKLDEFEVAEPEAQSDAATSSSSAGFCGSGNKRDLQFVESFVNALPASEVDDTALRERCGCSGSAASRWECVQHLMDECILMTILSGVESMRREYSGAVDRGRAGLDGSIVGACFELLGFDILLRAKTLQPVLMEVNHSPSLFCDTAFDFALKREVMGDTLHLIGSQTARARDCETKGRYEKAVKALRRRKEEDILAGTGWRRLLPSDKWSEEERAKYATLMKLCGSL